MQKKKKRLGIKTKLIFLSLFSVLFANTLMIILSAERQEKNMNEQAQDGLFMLSEAVHAGYGNLDGEYRLDENEQLWKGDLNLSEQVNLIDQYVTGSDAEVTIFYGKTRRLTTLTDPDTGERIIGTDMADEVWDAISKGERYQIDEIEINQSDYIACYIPLENNDGAVIGAVFAGKPRADIESSISRLRLMISGCGVLTLMIFGTSGIIGANKIGNSLQSAIRSIQQVADGDLNTEIDPKVLKRADEIGDIGRAASDLVNRLRKIVQNLSTASTELYNTGNNLDSMAASSSSSTEEISLAVDGISQGAMSQAEAINSASQQITSMGEMIEEIVNNVENLTRASNNMSSAGDASTMTMINLSESNDHTSEAITRIGKQIRLTDESVKKISEATELITSIASQTSLLSLNASIESARAGEAGRGFAVVASEIQKLSIQSNDAAEEIQQIIDTLLSESAKTLEEMQDTEALMKEQQSKLNDTKSKFDEVSDGIRISREETEQIRTSAGSCNKAKEAIMDVISNLSAISEENAASTEETSASMQELNATISHLATESGKLKAISQELNEYMGFFKI
ncbi:MAG: cache domain-containing protein [Lachnospiraceae bacterium]|nr:cache domain-containing protein [Lachnospiraceae bacterium]